MAAMKAHLSGLPAGTQVADIHGEALCLPRLLNPVSAQHSDSPSHRMWTPLRVDPGLKAPHQPVLWSGALLAQSPFLPTLLSQVSDLNLILSLVPSLSASSLFACFTVKPLSKSCACLNPVLVAAFRDLNWHTGPGCVTNWRAVDAYSQVFG